MAIDKEYPGDSRMDPVDVDVLDNLMNAQAAYLSAVSDAASHAGIHPDSVPGDLITDVTLAAFKEVSGTILNALMVERV